jgi:hypothetical protein
MLRQISIRAFSALLTLGISVCAAKAGDQAKAIVNGLDPNSMNELFEVAKTQPDAALTNIAPVSANTFRFLFIWPASNTIMTYDRVGRSFAERFGLFADRVKLLVTGFCLPSRNMFFGTAMYGDQEVNVAYRDIQVRYQFGWQGACAGRYISASELEQSSARSQAPGTYGASTLPRTPSSPPKPQLSPEEGLKPFLNRVPSAPLE